MLSNLLKTIRFRLTEYTKRHLRFREWLRRCRSILRLLRYKAETFRIRTDPKTVLFDAFGGASFSDNPRALFETMLSSGKFADYTFVWGFRKDLDARRRDLAATVAACRPSASGIASEPETEASDTTLQPSAFRIVSGAAPQSSTFGTASEALQGEFEVASAVSGGHGPKVLAVEFGGKQWRRYAAQAGWWIFNSKMDDSLIPKKDQTFVQTWHGTPLKRLGYDLEHYDNAILTKESIRKRYAREIRKIDYFLSPSPYASETFRSAWRMEDFGKADILLEEGYPRNDVLINHTPEDEQRIRRQILPDIDPGAKTVVLYAPTYRADQHETGKGYTYRPELDFGRLQTELGEDYVILFRAHYYIANSFDFERYAGFVRDVSGVQEIRELYLIADILVTDYSSSMFDYANLRRPMIFYMYDLEHYRDQSNGFYFDPEEVLPGPIVRTPDELVEALRKAPADSTWDARYERFRKRFDPWDDGYAGERVIRRLFGD